MKKRIDLLLVEKKFAVSRTRAQDLIKEGVVWAFSGGKWAQAKSPGQLFPAEIEIKMRDSGLNRFVSRGGLKLEGALDFLKFPVDHLDVLDVGLSTGGFSDCLLQRGAKKVVGIDVGHGQLHPSLRNNPKLVSIEGLNARELSTSHELLAQMPEGGWPLIVVDVSFISLTLILPALEKVLRSQGHFLALVKPQFEVGPEGLSKGGLVKDPTFFQEVEKKIRQKSLELHLTVLEYLNSSIEGKDGNREFFVFARKNAESAESSIF